MSLKDTIISLRAHLLNTGASAPLNWWSGQPFSQEVILKRLFPATSDQAALEVVAHSARVLGLENLSDALTLFDLGETRETLLRAHQPASFEPLFAENGTVLSETLLARFPELSGSDVRSDNAQWRENRVLGRVETRLENLHEPLSDEDVKLVLQVLLNGLRYSQAGSGQYLQPVILRAP